MNNGLYGDNNNSHHRGRANHNIVEDKIIMVGTQIGGQKAAATNKATYGEGFYARIGTKGGMIGRTGGFASEKVGKDGLTGLERAKKVGAIGGKISRRGPAYEVKK